MEKLEQKILDSASTGGSTSSIGAQILEKGIGRLDANAAIELPKTPEEITKENDALVVNVMQEALKDSQQIPAESASPRGGRGTQADSSILGPAIESALKEEAAPISPVDPAVIEKAQKEKGKLLVDLADLRVRERQAQTENLSQETKDLITENIRSVYKKLSTVNLSIPDADPQEDAAAVRKVMAEYDEEARVANAKKTETAEQITPEEVSSVPLEEITPTTPETLSLVQEEPAAEKAPEAQVGYSEALDRIWKENEEKRKAMSMGSNGENLALEPLAIETTTPEVISLPVPAGAEGPHLAGSTEVRQGSTTIEGYFTRVLEDKTSVEQGTELALTAEQLKQVKLERIRTKLEAMTGAVEARAEKVGMVDNIRKIGAMWNKVPKRYKYLLAGGALLSGVGAAAAGSAVALGAVGALGTALRGLSGAGLFVTFETVLKNAHEKKTGGERSKAVETRHMLLASLGAVAFAALLPKMISEYMGSEALHTGAQGTGATAIETPEVAPTQHIEYVVGKGGTLWGGIEEQLHAKGLLSNLHGGQKTYMIDAIKDKFSAMSPAELRAIGITSGRIDLIHPGDHIDLTKVLGDTSVMNEVASHAQGLSPEQLYSIEHPPVAHHVGPELATPTLPGDHAAFSGTTPEATSSMPQEITPEDPRIIARAEHVAQNYVNETFGSKGILGFGAEVGTHSIDWNDPDVGFANHPVDKVLAAHPSAFPADGARHFGVEDYSATQKMQAGLAEVVKETGVTARPNEKVGEYLIRAAANALSQHPELTVTSATLRT